VVFQITGLKFKFMKKILIQLIVIFSVLVTQAQNEEETLKPSVLIPFTGMDYVRVVFSKDLILSPSNTFKAVLKSPDEKILWQGEVKPNTAVNEGGNHLAFTIANLKPVLWSPGNPYLYELIVQQLDKGVVKQTLKERVGFRSFERRGGNFFLNGKPLFLRGIAINPPGRGIPSGLENSRAFALDYVKFMKSINVNMIRIPDAEEWYDVCDELGMMVFGGNYGGKVAGGEKVEAQTKVGDETDGGFPADYDKGVEWYENQKLGLIAHHPGLMVYAMTNETPFAGKRGELWEKFLDYAYNKLKKWDETRVYIANAGYGYGKSGDITDIHRYWGWYYSSPFTFLNIRDEAKINPYAGKHQPLTFTECVGNYTGPDGRYNLTPAHKNPSSQLAWTGHAAQELQAQLADAHQSFTFRQATESFRQLRSVNPDLSGVFPFTILFYNWNTIQKFADMKPKPVTEQVKISYQPVLLSWECWTPNVYAGSVIRPIAHIINDANDFTDLKKVRLIFEIRDKAQQILFSDSTQLADIPYYSTAQKRLELKLPLNLVSGKYQLSGKVVSDGVTVSRNFYDLFIADEIFTESVFRSCLENIHAITSWVEPIFLESTPRIPSYPDEWNELLKRSTAGFQDKLRRGMIPVERIKEYQERLVFELKVIRTMQAISYMLLFSDVVRFCDDPKNPDLWKEGLIPPEIDAMLPEEGKILRGTGRGSVGGSLVAWLLNITQGVDPLRFDLLFERFLDVNRVPKMELGL